MHIIIIFFTSTVTIISFGLTNPPSHSVANYLKYLGKLSNGILKCPISVNWGQWLNHPVCFTVDWLFSLQ